MKNKKEKKPKKRKQKRNSRGVGRTMLLVIPTLVVVVLASLYFHMQISEYEEGIMEIYATQQDAYVQLVLDQINIVTNRKDDEIVSDILGTVDASSNKYWTMSKNKSLIFVKDILETNRYQGFTAESYYITDSSRAFLNNLAVNHVSHQKVLIDGREYIASGVKFLYNGQDYEICLFTNPDTVLEHNDYLNAKINLTIMIGIVVAVFVIVSFTLALWIESVNRSHNIVEDDNARLRLTIEKINNAQKAQEIYDPKNSVFHGKFIPMFFEKLGDKMLVSLTLIRIAFKSEEDRSGFLSGSKIIFSQDYIRFGLGYDKILIAAINKDKEEIMECLGMLGAVDYEIEDYTLFDGDISSKLSEYMSFWGLEDNTNES